MTWLIHLVLEKKVDHFQILSLNFLFLSFSIIFQFYSFIYFCFYVFQLFFKKYSFIHLFKPKIHCLLIGFH